ncbi:MAG: 6-bladed beta-propeller [Acidobacteriota bacterium]|jgi:hypothetical protein
MNEERIGPFRPFLRLALTVAAIAVLAVACSSAPDEETAAADEWVGTITAEGNVTTVVNESGSVWGGDVSLIEATSIGVESGEDEYMLGAPEGVWATDDRIYVLDSQVPVLRVYDHTGTHVMDIGREGQGPGEFTFPSGVAVTDAGDILVVENSLQVDVFAPDGTPKDTWNSGSPMQVYMPQMIILGFDNQVWVPYIQRDPVRFGHAQLDEEGMAGETTFPPELEWDQQCVTYTRRGNQQRYCGIPFWPSPANALMLDGSWVVGVSSDYAFEIHRTDGTLLRVQRYWEPVPVTAEEAAYRKQQTTELVRERMGAGPDWTWNGPEIPDHKPAYVQLFPDRNGRIWVLREQRSELTTECSEDQPECWLPQGYWLDAFDIDGRFLGSVTLTQRPNSTFIDGSTILSSEMDATGTFVVKKYRVVLPGGARS